MDKEKPRKSGKRDRGDEALQARYKLLLEQLLRTLGQKSCSLFDSKEVFRICDYRSEVLGKFEREREQMASDLQALKEIVERARKLSDFSRNVRFAVRTLAEKGIERFEYILERPLIEGKTKREIDNIIIYRMVNFLSFCGVPEGRELYTVSAGILIYTKTIPADDLKLKEEVDVFGLSAHDMDKLRKGCIRARYLAASKLLPRGKTGEDDFLAHVHIKKPGDRPRDIVEFTEDKVRDFAGWTPYRPAERLRRGTILPNAGRKQDRGRKRR